MRRLIDLSQRLPRGNVWLVVGMMSFSPDAQGGRLGAQLGLDFFHAQSQNTGFNAGSPATQKLQDVSFRLRANLSEFNQRLKVRLHYLGREALPGDVSNKTLRLLHEAFATYEVIPEILHGTLGRFRAVSAVFLPIDGGRLSLTLPAGFSARAYGGRRAITTSREMVPIDQQLVAVGGSVAWKHRLGRVDIAGGYAQDLALVADDVEVYGSAFVRMRLQARPLPALRLFALGSLAERAGYILGPTWADSQVSVEVFDVMSAIASLEYRLLERLRLSYHFHFQKPSVYRLGTQTGTGGGLVPDVVTPAFVDHGLRVRWLPRGWGWFGAGIRYRLHTEKHEVRATASIVLQQMGLQGLEFRGKLAFDDDLYLDNVIEKTDTQRLFWSAGLALRRWGIELEAGASSVERRAAPVSGRQGDSTVPEDLALLTLAAQPIIYLRGEWSHKHWYVGLDTERLWTENEFRVLLHGGFYSGVEW
jgi:hypothetical protein